MIRRTSAPIRAKRLPANYFRNHRAPLAFDDARRQGDISQLAYLTMGGRDPAVAFLNDEHSVLGGRPLDIATRSREGYDKVARIIHAGAVST